MGDSNGLIDGWGTDRMRRRNCKVGGWLVDWHFGWLILQILDPELAIKKD